MQSLLKTADAISLVGAVIAGVALAALVLLGGAEIVLRSFFGTSLPFILEYNGYLLALAFLGGCGQAMREGGHIRVTMLPQTLPPRAARALDGVCTLVGLALASYLCMAMVRLAYGSYSYGTLSFYSTRTPLAYPQAAVAIMLAIFVLSLLARLVRLAIRVEPDRTPSATGVSH
jgi:TRAP-type C4-dicarboxylate transport system permease small subunit